MASIGDDDISLSSSDSEQEEEYTVEEILAERILDNSEPQYLVKWENYAEERCTWEPAESFLDHRSLQNWAKKRDAGLQPGSDRIDSIDAKIISYLDDKASRKARRQAMRSKLPVAGRPRRSSTITATSDSTIKSRKQRDRPETTNSLSATRSKTPNSNEEGQRLATEQRFGQAKLDNSRAGPSAHAIAAKKTVFHGISNVTTGKNGHHAHRTGDKRPYTSTTIRNLRHLNNVRKAARREPTPDVSQIRLRSLTEWAESTPKDTNLQLPPASTSRAPWIGGEKHATGESTQNFATESVRKLDSHVIPHNVVVGGAQPSISSGDNPTMIPNRVDSHPSQEKQLRMFANGRFVFFPGEFLANFKFGRAEIGDARVGGLPSWAIGYILKLRNSGQLRLEIGSNDVITPAQWAQLCTGRSNALQPTGVLVPYADTERTVNEMEQYLHQHCLAALWYHPTEDFMLVLYSPRSAAWSFLERMGGLPKDSNIRVLTRNKMPPTETLSEDSIAIADTHYHRTEEQPTNVSPHTPHSLAMSPESERGPASAIDKGDHSATPVALSRRGSGANGPGVPNSTSNTNIGGRSLGLSAEPSTQLSSRNKYTVENDEHEICLYRSPEIDPVDIQIDVPETESDHFQLPLQPGQTLGQAFWDVFQISYDHLTAVPPSKNVDRNPAKARFYLVFPDTAQRELDCLQSFLLSYTYQTNICTSMEERGWEAFQNIYKGDYIGVILFHEACTNYHVLPRLASYLRSSSLNVFRLSLARPLISCDGIFHMERLFPSGLAILLTEGAMNDEGIAILNWFGKKRRGPTWKLVLRPNVRRWLRTMALSSATEGSGRYIEILQLLDKLSPGFSALRHHPKSDEESSSEAESIDGLSDGLGGPGPLFVPSCIPAYDRPSPANDKRSDELRWKDHNLIEYFAGWSAVHAPFHRKFVAITPFPQRAISKWGHIEVLKPEKFMQREGIEVQRQVGSPKS